MIKRVEFMNYRYDAKMKKTHVDDDAIYRDHVSLIFSIG